jgi:hypothetical protein
MPDGQFCTGEEYVFQTKTEITPRPRTIPQNWHLTSVRLDISDSQRVMEQ